MSDNISNIIQNQNQTQNQTQKQKYLGRKLTVLKDSSDDVTYFQYDEDKIEIEYCQLGRSQEKESCTYQYEINENDFSTIISLFYDMEVKPGDSLSVRGDELSTYIKSQYGGFIGLT
jgi:hypothetical protein